MADERVLQEDVSARMRGAVEDPEKVEQWTGPDDRTAWALANLYTWEEHACPDLVRRAKKSFAYFNNDQWDPVVKQQMEAQKRPIQTFNEIRPKIKALSGEERRNREDWVARPREGSDTDEADVRTALLKYVRDLNNLPVEESRAFDDGAIGGYGGLACALVPSPERSAPPLLKVEYRPWWEFRWDWNVKARDWSDAQWMALAPMVDVERVREVFPDWDGVIVNEWNELTADLQQQGEMDIGERLGVSRYKHGLMSKTLYDKKQQRIRVMEYYYRTLRDLRHLRIRTPDGQMVRKYVDRDDPGMWAFADRLVRDGLAVEERERRPAIKGMLIVGRRTLAEWWSPFRGTNAFGIPIFPIFLWFASDTNGYIQGLVEPMWGPQDEVNKRWTMTVENYLKQARSGGVYEDGAFEKETDLKTKWGGPGEWVKANPGAIAGQKFREHTAKPHDQALMELFNVAERTMDRVSNIEKARLGLTSQETSGIAIRQRAAQSALVQVPEFDNFRQMQLQLGRFINANLSLMFPAQRAIRLTLPNGQNREVTLNERRLVNGIERIVNSTDGDAFDIVMDLTPANATFREMQAEIIANLLGQIGPAMRDNPYFQPVVALMLKGLMLSVDGFPNREEIVQATEQAVRMMQAPPAVPGMPGAPGAPGLPPDLGAPGAPPAPTPAAPEAPMIVPPPQRFAPQFSPVVEQPPPAGRAIGASSLLNGIQEQLARIRAMGGQ